MATFCSWVCISVWVKEYDGIETYLFYPVKSFLQNQRYRYNGCMLQHACYDKPSKLDYKASELLGAITGSGKAFPIELLEIFNQWADTDTLMSCSRQWLANITNGNNLLWQNTQDILLWKKEWLKAVAKNPSIKVNGDYLQNALKQFKTDKLISGYYVVTTREEHEAAIDKWHFIYSGSDNGDWNSVWNNKIYKTKPNGFWHAFVKGCAYDEDGLTGINSYGTQNGFFKIPWDLIGTTFTSYAIIDHQDAEELSIYRKKLMEAQVQKAVELGITNGQNLETPILRREAIVMIMRLYELLKK